MALGVGIRSPRWISRSYTGALSYKFDLYIDGSLRYTFIKNGTSAAIEVSDLVRDYVEPTFSGIMPDGPTATTNLSVLFTTIIKAYSGQNATGTLLNTYAGADYDGYLGYNYYRNGLNNFNFSTNQPLITARTLWYPEGVGGYFYANESGAVVRKSVGSSASVVSAGGETIKIRRFPCNKYDYERLVFINRFGLLQEIFFFAKKQESTRAERQEYKSNVVGYDGNYDNDRHQIQSYNVNGGNTYTLNTGYVSEDYNETIRELLLSEFVWMGTIAPVTPVVVTDSNVSYKTSLNDKLVSYTIQVKDAYDLISNMR